MHAFALMNGSNILRVHDVNEAKQCIETAYSVVKNDEHFVPFHIETIEARVQLLL